MDTVNKTSTYTEILGNLEKLPMFRLSLGSKELFHSNFLEFLWITDNNKFFSLIKQLCNSFDVSNQEYEGDIPKYYLSREKENFDICIYHKENDKDKFDLIIENKVKSIPRKEQLEDYYKKTSKNKSTPCLILLSLVEVFPDKSIIQDEKNQEKMGKWEIVNYESLQNGIEKFYGKDNTYIKDYCEFIKYLHPLQNCILKDFQKEDGIYFNLDELKAYKKLRLHDLYIKLRGALFLQKLKIKLEEEPLDNVDIFMMPCERAKTYTEIRSKKSNINENTPTEVFLNYTIQQGAGMVAAFIYRNNTKGDKIIEVVIQGNQYRHGINSQKYKKENNNTETERLDCLWKEVQQEEFMKKTKNGEKLRVKKGDYNKYNDDYIYKYLLIDGKKVNELIDWMTNDIRYVIESNNHGLLK